MNMGNDNKNKREAREQRLQEEYQRFSAGIAHLPEAERVQAASAWLNAGSPRKCGREDSFAHKMKENSFVYGVFQNEVDNILVTVERFDDEKKFTPYVNRIRALCAANGLKYSSQVIRAALYKMLEERTTP